VGLKNIKTTARNGKVVALKAVQNKDDLMMITANGMIIRTGLDEIRSIGRNTQGVRLIKLKAGDKLVAAEKIAYEDVGNPKGKSNPKPKAKPGSGTEPKAKGAGSSRNSKSKPKPKSAKTGRAKSKSKGKSKIRKRSSKRSRKS